MSLKTAKFNMKFISKLSFTLGGSFNSPSTVGFTGKTSSTSPTTAAGSSLTTWTAASSTTTTSAAEDTQVLL